MSGLIEVLFDYIFQSTGNLLIRIVTLGRIKTIPVINRTRDSEPLLGRRDASGALVCGTLPATLLGLIFWAAVGIGCVAIVTAERGS